MQTRFIPLLLFFLWAASLQAKDKSGKAAASSSQASEYDALFSSPGIPRIRILISTNGIETLQKSSWGFGQKPVRESVVATIQEGDHVYPQVVLHLKGSAGSFRSVDDKPAFTLSFDKHVKGQHFHGLRKMSLNNSVQDPTYLSEQFCRELFLQAGVPTPRARPARVELNGRDLGLYVLVEGWDREFLQRHFKDGSGTLYDGGFLKDITDPLSVNSGETPADQPDRLALVEAVKEPDLARRLERLNPILDVDRFLTFLALDVMMWDWDGYAMNKNNWRVYHDPSSGRMIFMPHGLDQMFSNPDGSIVPRMEGRVAQALLEIPGMRQRYFNRIKELRTRVFDVARLTRRVEQIAGTIAPEMARIDGSDPQEYLRRVDEFRGAIVRRGESLDRQLSHPMEPLNFDPSGLAALSGWTSAADFGVPSFSSNSVSSPDGTVEISARDGSTIGMLKTGIWIERGNYVLQGRVKTQGVVPDPGDSRGGAGFQVQGARLVEPLLGDSDWKMLELEFSVHEALAETQIACEFRGADGKAWFDLASLRVRRLPSMPSMPSRKRPR